MTSPKTAVALAEEHLRGTAALYEVVRAAKTQPHDLLSAAKEHSRQLTQAFLAAQRARRSDHTNRTSDKSYMTRLALEQDWEHGIGAVSDRLADMLNTDAAITTAQRAWITPPPDPEDGVLAGNMPGPIKKWQMTRKAKEKPPVVSSAVRAGDADKVEAWGGKRGSMGWLALQSQDPSNIRIMRDANGDPVAVASVGKEGGDLRVRILAAKEGYGGKMMQALAGEAHSEGLGVRLVSTYGAEGFYNRLGMKQGEYLGQYGWTREQAGAFARTGGFLPPPATTPAGTSSTLASQAEQQLAFNILQSIAGGGKPTADTIRSALATGVNTTAWERGAVQDYLGLTIPTSEAAGRISLEHMGLGQTWEFANPRQMAEDMHAVRGSKVIENLYGQHLDDLTKIITAATDPRNPMNMAQVKSEIKAKWPALRRYQVERIARSETAAVWTATAANAYAANGISEFESLVAQGPSIGIASEMPCDICVEAAAGVHDMSDDLPPWHPNCRCEAVPVLESDDGEEWLPPDEPWTGGGDGSGPALVQAVPTPPPVRTLNSPVTPHEPDPLPPAATDGMTQPGISRNELKSQAAKTVVNDGLTRIGQVHKVPDWADSPYVSGKTFNAYSSDENAIFLNPRPMVNGEKGYLNEWSFIHEYGHYVEEQRLVPFNDAYHIGDLAEKTPEWSRFAQYDQDYNEVFARAYQQWIAEKTGSLDALIAHAGESKYWSAESFAPIRSELDRMFSEKGMLNTGKNETVIPPPPKPPTYTPTDLTPEEARLMTTGDLWRAMSRNGHAENEARADIALAQDKLIADELWRRGDDKGLPEGTLRYSDLKGETHYHTTASDGHESLEEMARAAHAHGQIEMAVSEHANLMTTEDFAAQRAEIDALNAKFAAEGTDMKVLQGVEVNILKDGSLDLPDEVLAKFDRVNAGMHVERNVNATERYMKVLDNEYVTTLAHPHTGGDVVDWEKLAQKAAEKKIALEVNGRDILRLDNGQAADHMIAAAKKYGAKMQIGADAHNNINLVDSLYAVRFAAKRGVTAEDILPLQRRLIDDVSVPGEPPISADALAIIKDKKLDIKEQDIPPPGTLGAKLLDGAHDTQQKYTVGRGQYVAERKPYHDAYLRDELAKGTTEAKPIALVMAGGPAAGKSVALRATPEMIPDRAVMINPDEAMEHLPENKLLDGDRYKAAIMHEEGADMAARLLGEAIDRRMNVVVDGVGDSASGKFFGKLKMLKEAGYEVRVVMADAPLNVAIERNIERASKVGGPDYNRYVPVRVQKQLYRDAVTRTDEWMKSGYVDDWRLIRSEGSWGDTKVVTVARGGKGKLEILDRPQWDKVQAKRLLEDVEPVKAPEPHVETPPPPPPAPTPSAPMAERFPEPKTITPETWSEHEFYGTLRPYVGRDVRIMSEINGRRATTEGTLKWDTGGDIPIIHETAYGSDVTLGNGKFTEDIQVKGADGEWHSVAEKPQSARAPDAAEPPTPPKPGAPEGFSGELVDPRDRATVRIGNVELKRAVNDALDNLTAHVKLPTEAKTVDIVPGAGQSSNFNPAGIQRGGKYGGAKIRVSSVRGDQAYYDRLDSTYHEYGHYLDWNYGKSGAWQGVTYGSEANEAFRPLMQAFVKTPEYKVWADFYSGRVKPPPEVWAPKSHARYMKSSVELFARGFSQYMATVTKDEKMLAFIAEHVPIEKGGWYWTPENFAPIKEEFDKLFAEKGILVASEKAPAAVAAPELVAQDTKPWEQATAKWYGKLTGVEDTAIRHYTDEASATVNEALRNPTSATENDRAAAEFMRQALAKASSPEATVYRAGPEMTALFGNATIDEKLIGREFTDKAFLSTSTNLDRTKHPDIVLRIRVPEGSQAVYVKMLSEYKKEDEVIIQAGSAYRVMNVTKADGKTIIDLTAKTPRVEPAPEPAAPAAPTPAPVSTAPHVTTDITTREGFEQVLRHYEGQQVRVTMVGGRKFTGPIKIKEPHVLIGGARFFRGFEDMKSIEVKIGGRYKDWKEVESKGGVEAATPPPPRGVRTGTPASEVKVPEGGWQFPDAPPSGVIGDYPPTPQFASLVEAKAFAEKFLAKDVYLGQNPDLRGVQQALDAVASVLRPFGVRLTRLHVDRITGMKALAYHSETGRTLMIDGKRTRVNGQLIHGSVKSMNPRMAKESSDNLETFNRKKAEEIDRLTRWINEADVRHTVPETVERYKQELAQWQGATRWLVANEDRGANAIRAVWAHEAAHALSFSVGKERLAAGDFLPEGATSGPSEWMAAKFAQRLDANGVTGAEKWRVSAYGASGDNTRQLKGSELWAETTAARVSGLWDLVPASIQKAYDETLASVTPEMLAASVERGSFVMSTDEEKAQRLKDALAQQEAERRRAMESDMQKGNTSTLAIRKRLGLH